MRKNRSTQLLEGVLSDKESIILKAKIMGLPEKRALKYCEENGHKMVASTYYKILSEIRDKTNSRLIRYATDDLKKKQMHRMDELATIEAEFWKQYQAETTPSKKAMILEKIVQMHPYIAATEADIAMVLSKQNELKEIVENAYKVLKKPKVEKK